MCDDHRIIMEHSNAEETEGPTTCEAPASTNSSSSATGQASKDELDHEVEMEHDGIDTEQDIEHEETGEEDHGLEEVGDEHEGTEEEGEIKQDHLTPQQRARHAITGRGVTLSMLMADSVIEPGENNMSIEYLGQKFTADLLQDGRIRWREEDKIFGSPSAWAIHCKKIVNPMKKSGCGWASVKYKGKKLNAFKSTWTRKQRPISGLATASFNGKEETVEESSDGDEPEEKKIKEEPDDELSSQAGTRHEFRPSVKHGTLGRKSHLHDPNTLIECTSFSTLGKIQPFNITVASNALLLMDFHCHLTSSEIVGYLGGKWDSNAQCLAIQQAFPCACRLGDQENGSRVEQAIRSGMAERGLTLVGWYHSHPHSQPDPSLRDIEAQMEYQLQLMGPNHNYHPCLGLIISPYDPRSRHKGQKESSTRLFWVMPPPEQRPLDYGMPMSMHYDIKNDSYLSKEILSDMKKLVDFYKGEPDIIDFSEPWQETITQLEKVKGSLNRKLPKEQATNQTMKFIESLLTENDNGAASHIGDSAASTSEAELQTTSSSSAHVAGDSSTPHMISAVDMSFTNKNSEPSGAVLHSQV